MDYFLLVVFGFSAGVLARSLVAFSWPVLLLLLLLGLLSVLLFYVEKARLYLGAAVFLAAAICGAGRTMLAPQALPSAFVPMLESQMTLEGKIAADPDLRDTNQHLAIVVEKDGEETTVLAYAPLYPSVSYGETVRVSGTLYAPEPFDTDGGRVFTYDKYLAKDGIFAVIPRARVESVAPPSGLLAATLGSLYAVKHIFANGLEAALPEPAAALAEGLLIGGKQGLGKDLIEVFTISGLIQIVVLSGYNVMVVANSIRRGVSYASRRFAMPAALIGIAAFVLMSGAGAAALRAGLMAMIAIYARESGRSYDALRGLFLTLLLLTLWNPLALAFDPGFQLSFIATLGLIIGTPLIEPKIAFIKNAFLREIIATTIAAQVAVLPLLLYQTGNLSLVSLIANVLVLPVIPLTMFFGFVAGVTGAVIPFLGSVVGVPAFVLLSYIVAVGEYAADIPLARLIIPAFPFALVLVAYAALWYWVRRLPHQPTPPLPQNAPRTHAS